MSRVFIDEIADHANQKIENVKERYKSKYDVADTMNSEILCVLGIIQSSLEHRKLLVTKLNTYGIQLVLE